MIRIGEGEASRWVVGETSKETEVAKANVWELYRVPPQKNFLHHLAGQSFFAILVYITSNFQIVSKQIKILHAKFYFSCVFSLNLKILVRLGSGLCKN